MMRTHNRTMTAFLFSLAIAFVGSARDLRACEPAQPSSCCETGKRACGCCDSVPLTAETPVEADADAARPVAATGDAACVCREGQAPATPASSQKTTPVSHRDSLEAGHFAALHWATPRPNTHPHATISGEWAARSLHAHLSARLRC